MRTPIGRIPIRYLAVIILAFGVSFAAHAATVDIIFVVDESGSMSGEHAWLPGMVNSLDTQLGGLGIATNYGLFGFGGGGSGNLGRTLLNGGNAAAFGTSAANLVLSGSFEDGYSGLDFALNQFTFSPGGAVNYILVTDEDRDNGNNALTFASTLAFMQGQNALLNAVVNNNFGCPPSTTGGLGIDADGDLYLADGAGGFTTCADPGVVGSGSGSTVADYVDLALATGGAAWNLNLLRTGGLTAQSFTDAFVNIKVQEISEQVGEVPEPGTILLFGTGLLALGWFRRRR